MDFGNINGPFSVYHKFLLHAIAVDVSTSDTYAGVRLFRALCVKTALLQFNRCDTAIHPSC